ncbi:tetratricopeptide repeat-containing sulfotransferase family protein [Alteromonas sp. CYL-A6]|uniref:tetratricopeptide repeat-containing sulfotransferase family protein n=1 Tax=Alteromonas nitratireducens TaxID=3390813 RepID=UPI0034AB9707
MSSTPQQILNTIKQAISQSQFDHALTHIGQALGDNPSDAMKDELLYMKAVALRLSSQTQAALNVLENLLDRRPDYGRAYQEKAYCYQLLNQPQDAATCFYRATRFNAALLPAWKQLLKIYQAAQNHDAVALATQQINYLQSLAPPVLGALDLMHEGQLHKAEAVCRQFLQQQPHEPEAMMLLAEIGIRLKVYHDAEFLLESCVALYPDNDRAAAAYQTLLSRLGKYPQAVSLARERLKRQPDNAVIQIALANALVGVGELDEAIALYQALLDSDNDRPAVWLSLGHALKARGDLGEAIDAYRQSAQFMPDFGDAYWSLANTKTYAFSSDDITAMKDMESRSDTGLEDRIHFCFALGKAFEDRRRYKESFSYYERGNALKKKLIQFDIERTEQAMQAQKAACPASLFAHQTGCDAPDPIFIVGLPRAGSTLLEQILASHSQVDGTMELHDILGIASRLSGGKTPYPYNLAELDAASCKKLGELYIEQTRSYRQGAPFFIDKMPNNFIHIGLIKRILPNAKIIDARRDPFACCFSGYKQLFGDGQEFSYSLSDIGRYYMGYVDLMDHWHQVLPGEVLTVQHEDVLADLEGQVRRLLDFCGLPFEQACLDFHKTKRVIKTPSSEQVRQPIYTSGMTQWENYKAHLMPLFDALNRYSE